MTESSLFTSDGLTLHVRHWAAAPAVASRGSVLILHGLGEHSGRYAAVAEHLSAWGWHVIACDQRGHGLSEGERGQLAREEDLLRDLALAIDMARDEHDGPLVLLGHSLGGLAAARMVGEGLEPQPQAWYRAIDGLVMSSPALGADMAPGQKRVLTSMSQMAPGTSVPNGLKPEWRSRDPEAVAEWQADPLVHDRIGPGLAKFFLEVGVWVREHAPAWTLPTLLLYAGADRCVSPEGSKTFAEAAPSAVLTSQRYEPMFHDLFSDPEKDEVYAALRAWLSTGLPARA